MDINIKNLDFSYGEQKIFENFKASIKNGQINYIVGASGCGKTTLLNILLGILPFSKGEISNLEKYKKSVVFQENRLCENISVKANIDLVSTGETKYSLKNLLDLFKLQNTENKKASRLSGGMKRRLSIIRAFYIPFDLMIMDEPFKEMDKELIEYIIPLIKSMLKGKTAIIATHHTEHISKLDNVIEI